MVERDPEDMSVGFGFKGAEAHSGVRHVGLHNVVDTYQVVFLIGSVEWDAC